MTVGETLIKVMWQRYYLPAAIFCRFKSKSKRVTESDVHSLIRSLPRDKAMGSKAEMSANKNADVRKDFVWLHWGLSQNNYDAVKDDTLWQAWSKYTAAAVTYANSTRVSNMLICSIIITYIIEYRY